MTTKHHISHAAQLYYGNAHNAAIFAANERDGIPINPLTKVSLGSPVALDADGLIVAATSTELPNATSKTYTTATDNTSPLDGAIAAPSTVFLDGQDRLVWVLDVPRNITGVVSHNTTTLAMTVTINGYDKYGVPMKETLTFPATATSVAVAGLKAFKYIYSYTITAAGNATTNTLNLGWGDVLGLPYVMDSLTDVIKTWFNGVSEATAPTVVAADTTDPATAVTGDVRGTIDTNSACDGSAIVLWAKFNPDIYGVAQYAG